MIVYEEIIVSASSNASVLVVTVSITRIIRKCGTFTNKIVLLDADVHSSFNNDKMTC
jgi:hypothetical protein